MISDFIVPINKKERIDKRYDFSDIDNLYEAFLLIVNITQLNDNESYFLGGVDIYDKSKTIQKLIEKIMKFFQILLILVKIYLIFLFLNFIFTKMEH